ncbi:hypothetical protein [Halodesulfovibrio aestuarii]|uniref:Transposase n=1 Tax=Halodesulfovibrio aestuarii TaxID=126333 RepID=A0ABV4JQU5_9BACT
MDAAEIFEWIARYVWPFVLMWNVYLFQYAQTSRNQLQEFKLYVARNYTSKQDLEKMLAGFEDRFEKRFEQLFQLINTK